MNPIDWRETDGKKSKTNEYRFSSSMILFSILLMARIIEDSEIMDLVSLVTGAAASFCYGKFLWIKQKSWLTLSVILFALCIFFFIRYLF